MIALCVAYSKNRVIGNEGKIPWRISGEQRRFKELTTCNIVVMGRRTFEEIGIPLPNRTTYIVSKTVTYNHADVEMVSSLEEAIKKAGNRDLYISGGAKLYEEAINLVDKMYITVIEKEYEGDTFFPDYKEEDFVKVFEERHEGDVPYTYITYARK